MTLISTKKITIFNLRDLRIRGEPWVRLVQVLFKKSLKESKLLGNEFKSKYLYFVGWFHGLQTTLISFGLAMLHSSAWLPNNCDDSDCRL